MKMTNIEAFHSVNVMSGLRESGKLGYAIARNMRKLNDELTEYIHIRDELIRKYGTSQGENEYRIPPENTELFVQEMSEYNNIEFEFIPYKIPESLFYSGGMTSDQMYELDWMVDI